jgi:hypothetical protein
MSTLTSEILTNFDVEKLREDFPVLKQQSHGAKTVRGDRRHPPLP